MAEFEFPSDGWPLPPIGDGPWQESLPMDIVRSSDALYPLPEDHDVSSIVARHERGRESLVAPEEIRETPTEAGDRAAVPDAVEQQVAADAGTIPSETDTPEGDLEDGHDRPQTQSNLEFVALNSLDNRSHSQQTATTLDLLSQVLFDEEYDSNFEHDEVVPLLYGVIENGRMVAAGSLRNEYTREGVYSLGLIGVAPDRQGEGLGTELLKRLEEEAVRLGATALTVDSTYASAQFYQNRGYVENPEDDDELSFIKYFPRSENPNG